MSKPPFNIRTTLVMAGGSRADYRRQQQIPDPPELPGDTVGCSRRLICIMRVQLRRGF